MSHQGKTQQTKIMTPRTSLNMSEEDGENMKMNDPRMKSKGSISTNRQSIQNYYKNSNLKQNDC